MAAAPLGALREEYVPREAEGKASEPAVQRRRRVVRINWSRVVLLLAIIYTAASLVTQHVQATKIEAEIDGLETQLADAQALNGQLNTELERLQNDPSYVEFVARRELGMVKQGEIQYIFTTR